MPSQLRKPVHELNAADFEVFEVWEYADDEDVPGQDECTVSPAPPTAIRSAGHQLLVRAEFLFPNGVTLPGVVTLNAGADPSGHQPGLFLPGGEVIYFYRGATRPTPSAIADFRAALLLISEPSLPVRYQSAIAHGLGDPIASGELHGLYWLCDIATGQLRAEA